MNATSAACGLPTPEDLYSRPGLERLDARFDQFLRERDPALAMRLAAARAGDGLARWEESELWLALAPFVDEFLGALFSIGAQVAELIKRQDDLEVVFEVRRKFVQRHIAKKANGEAAAGIDGDEALEALEAHLQGAFEPVRFARAVRSWL